MSITNHFCKLMDLPDDIAISEGKSKFQDTYMYINGELTYVEQITNERIVVIPNGEDHKTLRSRDIEDIEVWLPLSGIYMIRGVLVHLWKIPKRQWKKSFSWNYYTSNHGNVDVYALNSATRTELFRFKNNLMYYDLAIAEFKGNEIITILPEFGSEIELYKEHINAKV